MGSHAAPRRSRGTGRRATARRRAPWGRIALSLCVLLGMGSAGTLAYWTDTATVSTGQLQSGTLDLRIDGNLAGPGGTTTTPLAMTNMVPGESVAVLVPVQNPAGSVGFRYRATAYATGELAPGLRWTVVPGGALGNVVTTNGLRTQACGTTATTPATFTSAVLGTGPTSQSAVIDARRTVATNASESVCVRVELNPDAGNGLQTKSATATFTFDALQVGAA